MLDDAAMYPSTAMGGTTVTAANMPLYHAQQVLEGIAAKPQESPAEVDNHQRPCPETLACVACAAT